AVNLDGPDRTVLSRSVIGQLRAPLQRIELACAAVLIACLILQWFILRPMGTAIVEPALRTTLFVIATAFLVYDWRVVWPRMWQFRQEYLDNADNPEIANPALDQFDRYQAESLTILRNILFLLMGVILFSATIHLPAQVISFQTR